MKGTPSYVALVDRFERKARYPDLVTLAAAHPESGVAVDAIKVLCGRGQERLLMAALGGSDVEAGAALARALGNAADQRTTPLLAAVVDDQNAPPTVAQEAAKALGKTPRGARELLRRIRENALAPELKQAVAFALADDRLQRRPVEARNRRPLAAAAGSQRQTASPAGHAPEVQGRRDAREGDFQRHRQMQYLPHGQRRRQGGRPQPLGNRLQAES